MKTAIAELASEIRDLWAAVEAGGNDRNVVSLPLRGGRAGAA